MKRNLVILVAILGAILVISGVTYAYFTSSFKQENNPGEGVSVTTAEINGVGLEIEGKLEFEDLDILPGHENISAIRVTASGNNQVVSYNLVWRGTNGLNTPLEYEVYRTLEPVDPKPEISCVKMRSGNANYRKYYEECTRTNFEALKGKIASGTINKTEGEASVNLVLNEVLKGTEEGSTAYYYVVIRYPNKDDSQNSDLSGSFEGVVTVEKADAAASDITIAKIYKKVNGKYTETNKAPSKDEGYTLDLGSSHCDNGTLSYDAENNGINIADISGHVSCDLYYMEGE